VERERVERIQQEQRAREAAELAAIRLEAERRAEDERQARLEEERKQREAAEAEQKRVQEEQERQAQLAREREAAERQRREAEEARRRAAMAAEVAAAAAAEQADRNAASSGLREQWAGAIGRKVEQRWQRPPNATINLVCLLVVTQLPTGEVIGVVVDECNTTDANIIRSLENAVQNASPLPQRPAGVAFERVIRIRFKPTE
jgi:colicin import membrane protein